MIATPQPTPRRMWPTSAVQPGAAGQPHRVAVVAADGLVGQRQRRRLADAPRDRRDVLDDLAGDQPVAGLHRVAQPDLDRVEAARRGELVHLRLVGEARLHDAEAAHRPARQVVGAHRPAVDRRRSAHLYGPWAWVMRVDQHGRRRRRVGAAVEHEPGLDLDDLAVGGRRGGASRSSPGGGGRGRGSSPRGCRRIRTGRPVRSASRQVWTCRLMSSRAPNAPPTPPSVSRTCSSGEAEAGGDLLAVLVQPLRGDVQLDAAAAGVGDRQRRLEAEERLVLHADLVGALDDDVAGRRRVAAARSRWWRMTLPSGWIGGWRAVDRRLGVDQRLEHLVRRRRSRRAPGGTSRGGRRRRRRPARRRSARRRWRTPAGPGAIRP